MTTSNNNQPTVGTWRNLLTQLDRHSHNTLDTIAALTGWKRYLVAFLSGIAVTLAMAPYYLSPLLVIGYSLLFTQLGSASLNKRAKPLTRAFFVGWAFGFGFFISGIYWMGFAFLVRAEEFAWMIPIAIPAFAGFLGLFFAIPALGFAALQKKPSPNQWQKAFLFAVLISLFEYLRGHILTGLPWNLSGQAMMGWIAGAQTVSIYGVYGLSLIVILLSTLPACGIGHNKPHGKGVLISLGGFTLLYAIGGIILLFSPTRYTDEITVSIIQPNISQKDKINPDLVSQNFEKLISLSEKSHAGKQQQTPAQYMIWPENAVSWIDEQPYVLEVIRNRIAAETIILTGSIRRDMDDNGNEHFYNTMAVLEATEQARIVSEFYDKHHLVPFGEYLPLKGFLRAIGLSQLAPVEDGFTPGKGPRTLSLGPAPFAPLICYETIFPGAMHPRNNRPRWLMTVTNDAWFGDNAGPKQHLDQARLRAIETGLPLLRSANTGISAAIDPHGRVLKQIDLYQAGVIDVRLPIALKTTLYGKTGDSLYFLMLFAGFVLAIHNPKRKVIH